MTTLTLNNDLSGTAPSTQYHAMSSSSSDDNDNVMGQTSSDDADESEILTVKIQVIQKTDLLNTKLMTTTTTRTTTSHHNKLL
jgi:hypothetical protein